MFMSKKRSFIAATTLTIDALFFVQPVQTVPCAEIPSHLYNEYTKCGKIPVVYNFRDDSYSSNKPLVYTTNDINSSVYHVHQKGIGYYGSTDLYLYQAFEKYLPSIKNKEVAVLGSICSWYESVVIAYNGRPTTIEYNKIISLDSRLKTMTVAEYDKNPIKFDALVSISSFEHDGLGRYGDPIDPDGDIKAMARCKAMLKQGGLLFLAIPIAQDTLSWNTHRIYGEIRLPLLLEGWEIVDSFGFNEKDLQTIDASGAHQPVFVLRPKP